MKQLSPRSLKRLKENGTSNNQNQQQQQKEQKTYKVVVIGDCEVGKSGKLKNSFFLTFSFENCNKKIQIWMHLSLFEKIQHRFQKYSNYLNKSLESAKKTHTKQRFFWIDAQRIFNINFTLATYLQKQHLRVFREFLTFYEFSTIFVKTESGFVLIRFSY